jgi:hypothetical protein
MAHVCISASDVQAAGRWRDSKAAPLDWTLEHLIGVAVALKWLPASRTNLPNDEAVDKLTGEIGDAVRFVQYARNLVVHPASTHCRRHGSRSSVRTNTSSSMGSLEQL